MAEDQSDNPMEEFRLESQDVRELLSFRIHRLAIANDRHGQRLIMDRFGLTLPQWRVIGVIAAIGADAPIAQVLEDLSMNKSQLSREFKTLLEMGLVTSTPDPVDRRRLRASLTEKGQALHDEVLAFVHAQNEIMVSHLPHEDVAALMKNLDFLIQWTEAELERKRLS
jgi:DNA-binding MarR family transcriptional regulator